eukprot:scaffold65540_cov30-Prasinocladus_malaysianus.AAC.1
MDAQDDQKVSCAIYAKCINMFQRCIIGRVRRQSFSDTSSLLRVLSFNCGAPDRRPRALSGTIYEFLEVRKRMRFYYRVREHVDIVKVLDDMNMMRACKSRLNPAGNAPLTT